MADRSSSFVTESLRLSSPDPPSQRPSTTIPTDGKENDPTQPPFTQRPPAPSKPKRKDYPNVSESEEELPVKKKRATRRVRKEFDIEAAFTDDRASREEFQSKILAAINSGNEVLQQSAKDTATFQRSFLGVLNTLASK
jgi:hypothetical protein